MEKLIIENRSDLSMHDALRLASRVVWNGKISKTSKGDQYCFVTAFDDGLRVSASKNKSSDRLVIWNSSDEIRRYLMRGRL